MVTLALLTIVKHIFVGGKAAQYLATVLAQAPCQDITYIVSSIIQLWLEYAEQRGQIDPVLEPVGFLEVNGLSIGPAMGMSKMPVPDQTLYDQAKGILFSRIVGKQTGALPRDDTALTNVVNFIATTARRRSVLEIQDTGMIDGGAIALALIPFVDNVPILSDLLHAFRQLTTTTTTTTPKLERRDPSEDASSPCIPLSLINSEARKLLETIQMPAFQALLQTPIFVGRRWLCFSLLESLLGQDSGEDDMYTETRLLFDQVLG